MSWPPDPDALGAITIDVTPVIGGTVGDFLKVGATGKLEQSTVSGIGVEIGEPVTGGTPFSVLFVDNAGDVGQDPTFFDYDEHGGLKLQMHGRTNPVGHVNIHAVLELWAQADGVGDFPNSYGISFFDKNGVRASYFTSDGSYQTNLYAIISGYFTSAGGQRWQVAPPTGDNFMLGLGCDFAVGPTLVIRAGHSETDTFLISGSWGDDYPNPVRTYRVNADGKTLWGDFVAFVDVLANYDCSLGRIVDGVPKMAFQNDLRIGDGQTQHLEFFDADYFITAQNGLELHAPDHIDFYRGALIAQVTAAGITTVGNHLVDTSSNGPTVEQMKLKITTDVPGVVPVVFFKVLGSDNTSYYLPGYAIGA